MKDDYCSGWKMTIFNFLPKNIHQKSTLKSLLSPYIDDSTLETFFSLTPSASTSDILSAINKSVKITRRKNKGIQHFEKLLNAYFKYDINNMNFKCNSNIIFISDYGSLKAMVTPILGVLKNIVDSETCAQLLNDSDATEKLFIAHDNENSRHHDRSEDHRVLRELQDIQFIFTTFNTTIFNFFNVSL